MGYDIETLRTYHYVVNTFRGSMPVQLEGDVDAYSEENAINKLINDGVVYSRGYEFLELEIKG